MALQTNSSRLIFPYDRRAQRKSNPTKNNQTRFGGFLFARLKVKPVPGKGFIFCSPRPLDPKIRSRIFAVNNRTLPQTSQIINK